MSENRKLPWIVMGAICALAWAAGTARAQSTKTATVELTVNVAVSSGSSVAVSSGAVSGGSPLMGVTVQLAYRRHQLKLISSTPKTDARGNATFRFEHRKVLGKAAEVVIFLRGLKSRSFGGYRKALPKSGSAAVYFSLPKGSKVNGR